MGNLAQVNIGQEFFRGGVVGPILNNFQDLSGIGSLVSLFLNIAFLIAGIILLFYFIVGGIGIISSAGADDPKKLEQSKQTLTSGVIGLIIVVASYWIVQLIGQLFGLQGLTIFSTLFNVPR